MELYESIANILEKKGISRPSDLKEIEYETYRFPFEEFLEPPVDIITSEDYPNLVKKIFKVIEENYDSILNSWKRQPTPRLKSEIMFNRESFNSFWAPDDEVFQLRASYGCIFPRKVMYSSTSFVYWSDIPQWWIPKDFLALFTHLKPLLKNELAYLLPFRTYHWNSSRYKSGDEEIPKRYDDYWFPPARTLRGVKKGRGEYNHQVSIPRTGKGIVGLKKQAVKENISPASSQLLRMPWLYKAKTRDFVELVKKNQESFDVYNSLLEKLFNNPTASQKDIKSWLKKANYRVNKIESIYAKKKSNLKKRGRKIFLGSLFTVGSILLPELRDILGSVLGGKTIYDGIDWLIDYKNIDQTISSKDYWLLWKLKKSSEKEE